MADPMFTATVDASGALALLDRLGPSADFVGREVSRDTATRIVREAQSRVHRATGRTETGIHWELSRDGSGYIVLAYAKGNQPDPVDLYNEYGTMFMVAQPFFMAAALLEEEGHRRRMIDRMTEFLENVGR